MQVKIEEIREGGLKLNEPVAMTLIQEALAGTEGFRAEAPFEVAFRLSKVGSGVLLHGAFTATVVAPCKRCLTEVVLTLPTEFTLNLVPENLADQVGLDEAGDDDELVGLDKQMRKRPVMEGSFDPESCSFSTDASAYSERVVLAPARNRCLVCGGTAGSHDVITAVADLIAPLAT